MSAILWFRRDLRVDDNPLLAVKGEVLPIFIFDVNILGKLSPDDRRVSFIFEQVIALKTSLKARGLDLVIFHGRPEEVFTHLVDTLRPEAVYASGDYDGYARERDRTISHLLPFGYLHDTYIFEPDEVLKPDGSPYLVFTPFYKRSKTIFTPDHLKPVLPVSQQLTRYGADSIRTLDKSGLVHERPIELESIGFKKVDHGVPGLATLLKGFETRIAGYAHDRDFLAVDGTSHLSVHLRFGTLGIRQLLRWLVERKQRDIDTEPYFRELIFREFYAYLLYHFPALEWENYKYPFKGVEDEAAFNAFCEGRTGVPVVDAGIRELLATGDMHNRVRMICGSFLTKDLLLPWQWGEAFFATHLNDYDAASNVLSWQWCAGTGVDPQPYFRIFNPYRQSERFDKDAIYVKQWVPELASVPSRKLHEEAFLLSQEITGYPRPVVNHKEAAAAAQSYFKTCLGKQ
jgi:deoxyribodipyrimidine photo-lyase